VGLVHVAARIELLLARGVYRRAHSFSEGSQMTGGRPALVMRQRVRARSFRRSGYGPRTPSRYPRSAERAFTRGKVRTAKVATNTAPSGNGRCRRASQTRLRAP
jgi:hypothetical protein